MNTKKLSAAAICLLSITLKASAQAPGPDDTRFDLNQTMDRAITSSSAIQIARNTALIGEKRTAQQVAAGRLNLTGSAALNRYDQVTQIQVDPTAAPLTVLPDHSERFAVIASQRIDLFKQVSTAVSQARLQALADRFTVDTLTRQRRLDAQIVYYALLRARHLVQVAEAGLRAAKAQEDVARKLNEAGVGQKIDLLRAETNTANAQQDLERANNNEANARATFNDLVGRPLESPVELSDVAGVTVGVDIATSEVPVGTSPLPFTPFTPPVREVNITESIETAQKSRTEILQAETQLRANEVGVEITRVAERPTVTVSALGEYFPTTAFAFPRQRTATLTLGITVPILDGGLTRSRREEARERVNNARLTLDQTKSGVNLEVTQAHLNLMTAARQIETANVALTQAVAARQLAQVRYAGQVGLFLEVSDAQAALVRAENAQVDAVYTYLIARARLESAVGAL